LRATKQKTKKAAPKPERIKKENQGNGCPRAEALSKS